MNNNDGFSNKVMELLSNPGEAKKQLNDFAGTVQGNPKAQVEELIQSGKMSQSQYNLLSKFASMFMKFL